MRTRNGIYYDLTKSKFIYKVQDTGVAFVFSSDLHLTKFEEQYRPHRHDFNLKLIARFRLHTNFKNYADIVLYKKIETRGFLIVGEGGQKLCNENLLLSGEKVIAKS